MPAEGRPRMFLGSICFQLVYRGLQTRVPRVLGLGRRCELCPFRRQERKPSGTSTSRSYTSETQNLDPHTRPNNTLRVLPASARLSRSWAQQVRTERQAATASGDSSQPAHRGQGHGLSSHGERGGAWGLGGCGGTRQSGTFSRSSRMRCSCERRASQPCRTYAGDTSLSPAAKLSRFIVPVAIVAGQRGVDPKRTQDKTGRQRAAWTVRQDLGSKIRVSLSHMREPPLPVHRETGECEHARCWGAVSASSELQRTLKISPASLPRIGVVNA